MVVNSSLKEGVVPQALKETVVHSLLKEPSLSKMDSFCPVSNLPFLGKVVERMVEGYLQRTLDQADYLDAFQSRFRPGFGTEIALIALMGDLWHEWDGDNASILLELLASFNTISHGILLGWLGSWGEWHCVVLVLLLTLGSVSVGVDRRGENQAAAPTL